MLKKTITYTDYNGVERTEDFYFNLTQSELIKMELGTTGGLSEMIKNIVAAQDVPTIVKIFEDILFKAFGEKSADGKKFVKSEQISRDFAATEAYDKLFMELVSNPDSAAAFINALIPKESKNSTLPPAKK